MLFVMISGSAAAGGEKSVTLIENGNALCAIHIAPEVMKKPGKTRGPDWKKMDTAAFRRRLRASVLDLANYLEKMSSARVEVVEGPPTKDDNRLPIFIGKLARERFGAPRKHMRLGQGFRVTVLPEGIGLVGESRLGTSYAIYELLDDLGCRWYMPTEMGEVIPKKKTIRLTQKDYSKVPRTLYRGIWYCTEDYGRRNRLGGLLLHAGHALERRYLSKKEKENHPEWIATVDGKKNPRRLKWSAPGLAERIAENIIERLDENPETRSISLSPGDGLGFDNSSEDKALDAGDYDPVFGANSITDRLIWFCNKIARRVTEKHPKVLFGLLAYVNYNRPPVREQVHPNIVPEVAPITYSRAHPMTDDGEPNNKHLRHIVWGWGEAARMTAYYFYGWFLAAPAAPNPFITKWGENIPIIYKEGACRFWQPETTANFETTMHGLYMGIRTAWDTEQTPREIVDELNRNFYGHAAEQMSAYWDYIDHIWVDTPEYSGCGFGHMRRFTPERMKKARALMDAAVAACETKAEKFRVKMADDSLRLFESFMEMRHDLAEGRFEKLAPKAKRYRERLVELAKKYKPQRAFGMMRWTRGDSLYGRYFGSFYQRTYRDATRIAAEYELLTESPLRQWKYHVDRKKVGEKEGWQKANFDDSLWKTTDVCRQTWSSLGFHNYQGVMWYRGEVELEKPPAGQKVYLWIGATDGTAKVFVNGQHVPYRTKKGEEKELFSGYCRPASWDVSDALNAGKNELAVRCERTGLNELGTGGLLAPVAICLEKE
ncbi:MAG: DUF4838 domain-containing protein [Candidatus Brocadiia bacterium]